MVLSFTEKTKVPQNRTKTEPIKTYDRFTNPFQTPNVFSYDEQLCRVIEKSLRCTGLLMYKTG